MNFGDRLLDSPVILSVIVGLFIIYALLLLWARRADRNDRMRVCHLMICMTVKSNER